MINIGNYVLYMDSTYSVKVKSIDGEGSSHFQGRRYFLDGIDTEFFILGVFIDNKRRDGFEFYSESEDSSYHADNLFMKSIINDLGMTDLNMIPLNHFFQANKKFMFTLIEPVVGAIDESTYISPTYGAVRPKLFVFSLFAEPLTFERLRVNHLGSFGENKTEATIFKLGNNGFYSQHFQNAGFQYYPLGSTVFSIDDVFVKIDFLGNEDKFFQFDVQVDKVRNRVYFGMDASWKVKTVRPNVNGSTAWLFNCSDVNDTFNFDVAIDWKKVPVY